MSGEGARAGVRAPAITTVRGLVFALTPAVLLFAVIEWGVCGRLMFTERTMTSLRETRRGTYETQLGAWPFGERRVTTLYFNDFPEVYGDVQFDALPVKGSCVHVVVTGDSHTFGVAVGDGKTFTDLLRAKGAVHAPCVRFFNVAWPGSSIVTQARRVERVLTRTEADVVLLAGYANDLTEAAGEEPPWLVNMGVSVFGFDVERLQTVQVLRWLQRRGLYLAGKTWSADSGARGVPLNGEFGLPLIEPYRGELARNYSRLLGEFAGRLRAKGVKLLYVALSGVNDFQSGTHDFATLAGAACEEHGVAFLATHPAFESDRSFYPITMFEGHYNDAGHARLAEVIWPWLLTQAVKD